MCAFSSAQASSVASSSSAVFYLQWTQEQSDEEDRARAARLADRQSLVVTLGLQENLTSIDLKGQDLSGAYLRGKTFTLAQMEGANFTGANVVEAQLDGVNAQGANFERADLGQARIGKLDEPLDTLNPTNFSNANFHSACLANTVIADVNFEGTDFTGVDSG
jgi:uncharacterized protein YjbI with pentapeptide repeats